MIGLVKRLHTLTIVRYFFVGGAAAIIDIGVFIGLTKVVQIPWFWSACIAFGVATLVNYLLSIYHVFESGERYQRKHEVLLVFAVSGMGLALNQAIMWLLIENGLAQLLVAKLTAIGCVFFWNYFSRKKFIF
jgi:putative flippase GtrA